MDSLVLLRPIHPSGSRRSTKRRAFVTEFNDYSIMSRMASRGYLNAFVNRIVCFQTEKSMWPGQGGRRQTTIYLEEVKAPRIGTFVFTEVVRVSSNCTILMTQLVFLERERLRCSS